MRTSKSVALFSLALPWEVFSEDFCSGAWLSSWSRLRFEFPVFHLTPNTPQIQLWFARSKLNMDEICSLNNHLWYVDCRYTTNIFFEIPPCEKKVVFFTEFVTELVNPFIRKQSAHGGISKYFFYTTFHHHF